MKNRHTAEQIVGKLREAEVELAKGRKIPEGFFGMNCASKKAARLL